MKVSRAHYHGLTRWRVTWRSGGKTVRRFFKTLRAANKFAKNIAGEIAKYGEEWSGLPARDRAEIIDCWRRARERGYSIAEALRFWETHGAKSASGTTVSDLATKFLEAKRAKGLRPESLRLLETTMDQFKVGRENSKASDVSTEDVTAFLSERSWGPWRRRGVIIDLGNMFNWGIRAGLLIRNPVAPIERPTIEHKTPRVLSVEDCKRLLKLCRNEHPKLLAWLVISLFAGLRAAEVERLTWGDVKESHIALASHQTKGRARRLVKIRPVLEGWLTLCRKSDGSVCPGDHHKRANALRAEFGNWPKNVLRHSFISYALGVGEPIKDVAMESGNSEEIIFRHYREIVTQEQAKEFLGLTPSVMGASEA